jgi:hypothetical protein
MSEHYQIIIDRLNKKVCDLLNELKDNRRLIWLLIESAGGEIEVRRSLEMAFNEKQAYMTKFQDQKTMSSVYQSKWRNK